MNSKFSTIDYFSKTLRDPIHEVFEVYYDTEHPENPKLINDLKYINKDYLKKYVVDNNVDDFIQNANDSQDYQRRLHYFVYLITAAIANYRIEKLIESVKRPSPYHLKNLSDVIIDKNHMVSINQFNIDCYGFERNKLVYTLCPVIEQSNSSYWLFQVIHKLVTENNIKLRIRLDPFIEIPINKYHPMFYKMLVYSKQLDWNRLLNLKSDDDGKWMNEKEYKRMRFTEYIWSPKNDEIHFTCEELPKLSNYIRTSRYFHAIFNKKTGGITHCDGAIRYYSKNELDYRYNYHVKNSEVRKIGKRIKIFGFESKENDDNEIDHDSFCQLAVNFFVWNNDVLKYFS